MISCTRDTIVFTTRKNDAKALAGFKSTGIQFYDFLRLARGVVQLW